MEFFLLIFLGYFLIYLLLWLYVSHEYIKTQVEFSKLFDKFFYDGDYEVSFHKGKKYYDGRPFMTVHFPRLDVTGFCLKVNIDLEGNLLSDIYWGRHGNSSFPIRNLADIVIYQNRFDLGLNDKNAIKEIIEPSTKELAVMKRLERNNEF